MSRGPKVETERLNLRIAPDLLAAIQGQAQLEGLTSARWVKATLYDELMYRGWDRHGLIPREGYNAEIGKVRTK